MPSTITIIATVLPGVAFVCTLLRLSYRWRRGHLGSDDAWAAAALVSVAFEITGAWLRVAKGQSQYHHIVGYYMLNVAFTSVLWLARMSILFSTIRVIPNFMSLLWWSYASATLFFIMWIVTLAAKTYVCEHNQAWKKLANAQCVLGHGVAVLELVTDIVADIILIALAVKLFSSVKLGSPRRTMLLCIFGANAITTIISVVHACYVFSPNRIMEGIMAHVEAATCLIICNLAVLVTWAFRVFWKGRDLDALSYTETVELSRHGRSERLSRLTTLRFETDAAFVLSAMEGRNDPEFSNETVKTARNHSSLTLAPPSAKPGELYAV
ncbi:hypothetical protein OBBRIDRAFT_748622 [Obba rivulosa]|uniref:Rhodopsin domain-containing protein n=1 Tax=Obba rivulosa TaxID=1052685 RepID=A0A8E2DQI1_9APHY|nr:hypothetical protein OBBRIDRAFT_748622 [Obba rivulosa]